MLVSVEDDVSCFIQGLKIRLHESLDVAVARHHFVLDALERHRRRREDRADVLELDDVRDLEHEAERLAGDQYFLQNGLNYVNVVLLLQRTNSELKLARYLGAERELDWLDPDEIVDCQGQAPSLRQILRSLKHLAVLSTEKGDLFYQNQDIQIRVDYCANALWQVFLPFQLFGEHQVRFSRFFRHLHDVVPHARRDHARVLVRQNGVTDVLKIGEYEIVTLILTS